MTNKEEKPSLKPVTVRAAGSPEGKDGKHGETATDATGHYANSALLPTHKNRISTTMRLINSREYLVLFTFLNEFGVQNTTGLQGSLVCVSKVFRNFRDVCVTFDTYNI